MKKRDASMRILVAVDGSEASQGSLALVHAIDWPVGTTIDIVTVVEPIVPLTADPWMLVTLPPMSSKPGGWAYADDELRRHARSIVDGARAHVAAATRRVETAVLDGRPAVVILDRARTTHADLVVVGSRGHSTIETMLLGSVSAEVIDHADRPVLVSRDETLTRIVLAIDGSDSAAHAADLVSGWSVFSDTRVRVVSVAPLPAPWWNSLRDMAVPEAVEDVASRSRDVHERLATETAEQLRDRGIAAEPMWREGDPAAEIIEAAVTWDADLIVMGTRGLTGLKRAVLGSVARNVLAHAPCSVLVRSARTAVESTPDDMPD